MTRRVLRTLLYLLTPCSKYCTFETKYKCSSLGHNLADLRPKLKLGGSQFWGSVFLISLYVKSGYLQMNYRTAFTPTPTPLHEASPLREPPQCKPVNRTASAPGKKRPSPNQNSARAFHQRHRTYRTKRLQGLGAIIFALSIVIIALIGWVKRTENQITPAEGLGYWLGVVGCALMLLLLVYPLRKRLRLMRHVGPVTFWFRLHMIAGIIAPLLIAFHANFKSGGLSSSIALSSMLMVAFSGLIGRYLYGKLHNGLYGQRAQVREIIEDATMFKRVFGASLQNVPQIASQMQYYELQLLKPARGLTSNMWSIVLMRSQTRRCQTKLKRLAKKNIAARARQCGWTRTETQGRTKIAHDYLGYYFTALNRASSYRIYVRLFALWHRLHLPLFFFLVVSSIAHIITVHLQ